METVRSSRAAQCDTVRWQLCRLAAGVTLGDAALPLARHVKRCGGCDEFLDELAGLRSWVGSLRPGGRLDREDDVLRREARAALARELDARLARDLHDRVSSRAARDAEAIAADLRRVSRLRDARPLSHRDRRRLARMLDPRRPRPTAGPALALAAQLDPLGLDLGLAWLSQLARDGEALRAQREADRYLADVNGLGSGR